MTQFNDMNKDKKSAQPFDQTRQPQDQSGKKRDMNDRHNEGSSRTGKPSDSVHGHKDSSGHPSSPKR